MQGSSRFPTSFSLAAASRNPALSSTPTRPLHSTLTSAQANLARAPVRLQTFINNEPARGRDLVAWVTSGLYHVPISEDAPVTPTVYNHLGFMLIPFNYHDENAATDMADLFQIDNSNDAAPPVQVFAGDARYQCVPQFDKVPFSKQWDAN